ncbi:MAG: TIGR02453 family protein [Nitrospinaceae bacterium]|nr:MAG: TIGR02453 family protein [Nitrospinaceae bacterium]
MKFFSGFPKEGFKFLEELEKNNNKEWFQQNKTRYKESLETPTKNFVAVMTDKMQALIGGPVSGKIFRIYRDVRFSRDKTPYNPLVKIAFAPQDKKGKKGCSSAMYFFRLQPDSLALGAGVYDLNDNRALDSYRKRVADDEKGSQLAKILKKFRQNGLWINEPHYKRVPNGFDKKHPREDLLRHKGLYAFIETPVANQLSTEKAVDFCLKNYKDLIPLYNWLNGF